MLKLTDSIRYNTQSHSCLERYERWAEGFLNLGCGKTYRVVQIDQNKLVLAEAKTSFSNVATIRKMIVFVLTLGLLPLAALALRSYCRSKHRFVFHRETPVIQPVVKPAAPVPNLYLLCRLAGYRGPQHAEQASLAAWLETNGKAVRFLNGSKEGFTDTPGLEHFVNVKKLDLSFNGLKTVPEAIQHLKQLQELDFSGNPIETWPKWLEKMAANVRVIVNDEQSPSQPLLDRLEQHRVMQQSQQTKCWNKFLIPDIAGVVSKYLDSHKALMVLNQVSKNWKEVADHNASWLYFVNKFEMEGKEDIAANKVSAKEHLKRYLEMLRELKKTAGYGLPGLTAAEADSVRGNDLVSLINFFAKANIYNLHLDKPLILPVNRIGKLRKMRALTVNDSALTAWPAAWCHLTHLFSVTLINSSLKTIAGLTDLRNIEILKLYGNEIASLDGIEKLTNLETLDISRNKIRVIRGLDQLPKLGKLDLSYNPIQSLEPLEKLNANLKITLNKDMTIKLPTEKLGQKLKNKRLEIDDLMQGQAFSTFTSTHFYTFDCFNQVGMYSLQPQLNSKDLPIEALSIIYLKKIDLLNMVLVNRNWNQQFQFLWRVLFKRDFQNKKHKPYFTLQPISYFKGAFFAISSFEKLKLQTNP